MIFHEKPWKNTDFWGIYFRKPHLWHGVTKSCCNSGCTVSCCHLANALIWQAGYFAASNLNSTTVGLRLHGVQNAFHALVIASFQDQHRTAQFGQHGLQLLRSHRDQQVLFTIHGFQQTHLDHAAIQGFQRLSLQPCSLACQSFGTKHLHHETWWPKKGGNSATVWIRRKWHWRHGRQFRQIFVLGPSAQLKGNLSSVIGSQGRFRSFLNALFRLGFPCQGRCTPCPTVILSSFGSRWRQGRGPRGLHPFGSGLRHCRHRCIVLSEETRCLAIDVARCFASSRVFLVFPVFLVPGVPLGFGSNQHVLVNPNYPAFRPFHRFTFTSFAQCIDESAQAAPASVLHQSLKAIVRIHFSIDFM